MKFTKKTDYALRTMEYLGRQYYLGQKSTKENPSQSQPTPDKVTDFIPNPVSVLSISEQTHLSLRFLQGIVSKLSKAKLLRTLPGAKGGIMLARPPEAITLLHIIEAVEGKINLMNCLDHPEYCGDSKQCSIMSVLHTAQSAFVNSLSNTNLKLMVNTKKDPFNRVPTQHFLKPQFGCPVLK